MPITIFVTDTPFGRVPVLEVDGTKLAGLTNILRYLGIIFGEFCYVFRIIKINDVQNQAPYYNIVYVTIFHIQFYMQVWLVRMNWLMLSWEDLVTIYLT